MPFITIIIIIITVGSKILIDQTWCNVSVSTSCGVILPDISDHFPIYAQVKELGKFSGNIESYFTIKCRLKNSERDLMFRSLLEHFQYVVDCGVDNVDLL